MTKHLDTFVHILPNGCVEWDRTMEKGQTGQKDGLSRNGGVLPKVGADARLTVPIEDQPLVIEFHTAEGLREFYNECQRTGAYRSNPWKE